MIYEKVFSAHPVVLEDGAGQIPMMFDIVVEFCLRIIFKKKMFLLQSCEVNDAMTLFFDNTLFYFLLLSRIDYVDHQKLFHIFSVFHPSC